MKHTSWFLLTLLTVTLAIGFGQAQDPPPPDSPPPPPRASGPPPPPDPRPPRPPRGEAGPAEQSSYSRRGTVKAFNSGPEGEINGFILNDGTVVLFPPEAGREMNSAVREGSRISVAGVAKTGERGRMVVNAGSITANGRTFTINPGPPDGPPPPPEGPDRGRGEAGLRPPPLE